MKELERLFYTIFIPAIIATISIFIAHYLSIRLYALSVLSDKIMHKSFEILNYWDDVFFDKNSLTLEKLHEYNRLFKIKSAELDALVDAFDNKRTLITIPYRSKINYEGFLRVCGDDTHFTNDTDKSMILISQDDCLRMKADILKQLKVIFRSLY